MASSACVDGAQLGWMGTLPLVVGVGFLVNGVRVLTGKAPTLGGIAVASLLFAFLGVVVLMSYKREWMLAQTWFQVVLWAEVGCLAGAGVLALFGADKYASWATTRSKR